METTTNLKFKGEKYYYDHHESEQLIAFGSGWYSENNNDDRLGGDPIKVYLTRQDKGLDSIRIRPYTLQKFDSEKWIDVYEVNRTKSMLRQYYDEIFNAKKEYPEFGAIGTGLLKEIENSPNYAVWVTGKRISELGVEMDKMLKYWLKLVRKDFV